MISDSMRDRAPLLPFPEAASILSAPRARCTVSISRPGKQIWSCRHIRRNSKCKKAISAPPARRCWTRDRVLLNIGAAADKAGLVAFDAATGKVLWTATDQEASYSSPVAATINGVRHVIFFTRAGSWMSIRRTGRCAIRCAGVSRMQASVNAAVPLVVGDMVFLSSSYGTGATVMQITPSGLKQIWSSDDALTNHYATSVYRDGFLYGYHGRQEEGPSLRCIEFKTGKVRWDVDGFRAGTITLAGDRLLVLRESGELMLAPASPAAFKPIASAKILPGVVRSYPAIADGRLYARNEKTSGLSQPQIGVGRWDTFTIVLFASRS